MQKTYKFLIFLAFLFNLSSSFAQTPINTATTHSINIAKSKIIFFAKQSSVEVNGEFKKISGNIKFDPSNLESSSVEITIPIDSLYIGGFEKEMMNESWFHKSKFPNVYFSSSSIVKNGNGYVLNGKLKIKDISSDVRIPVTLSKEDNISYFAGEFTIKRADFKVGTGEWADLNVVANDVKLKFKLAVSSH